MPISQKPRKAKNTQSAYQGSFKPDYTRTGTRLVSTSHNGKKRTDYPRKIRNKEGQIVSIVD